MPILLWSKRRGEWWKARQDGYTSEVVLAGFYTAAEARSIPSVADGDTIVLDVTEYEGDVLTQAGSIVRSLLARRDAQLEKGDL